MYSKSVFGLHATAATLVMAASGNVQSAEFMHLDADTSVVDIANTTTSCGILGYGPVTAAAYDTGINCDALTSWSAEGFTGVLDSGSQLMSKLSTYSSALQLRDQSLGMVLDNQNDTPAASNPNAKLAWGPAGSRSRPTYSALEAVDPGNSQNIYLYPWHSAYGGGSNPVLLLNFDALVKNAATYSGNLPSHATISLLLLDKSTNQQYFHQCKIFINQYHPKTLNSVGFDPGTSKAMAISLLSNNAKYCNSAAGYPATYRTIPWTSPETYNLRFTWNHLLNAIGDINAAPNSGLAQPLSTNRNNYRLVYVFLNIELGRRSTANYAGKGMLSGSYSNFGVRTITY